MKNHEANIFSVNMVSFRAQKSFYLKSCIYHVVLLTRIYSILGVPFPRELGSITDKSRSLMCFLSSSQFSIDGLSSWPPSGQNAHVNKFISPLSRHEMITLYSINIKLQQQHSHIDFLLWRLLECCHINKWKETSSPEIPVKICMFPSLHPFLMLLLVRAV